MNCGHAVLMLRWGALALIGGTVLASARLASQMSLDRELVRAVKAGDTATAVSLLDDGANVNARDSASASRHFWAAMREAFRIQRQARPTCLLLALCRYGPGNSVRFYHNSALVATLLDHGADCNEKDRTGRTPVMIAAWSSSREVMRLLVEHGADVNATEPGGYSALLYRCREGDAEAVDYLLNHGAKPDVRARHEGEGSTPLMCAVFYKNERMASSLLAHHASLQFRGNSGMTPVAYARALHCSKRFLGILKRAGTSLRTSGTREEIIPAVAGHAEPLPSIHNSTARRQSRCESNRLTR